jgi:hypothetical protein
MSEAEKRSRALQVAAKSLTLVAEFKEDPEIQAALQEEPLLAAVCAKAEAATAVLQSALDADADTPLSVQDLNLLMVWDEALILPTSVSMVMVTDYMWTRVLPAYDLLQQRAVAMGMSHEEILAFMPVTARLLCSAVPGFKAFVWLPAKLRYALELIKVCSLAGAQCLMQQQQLLQQHTQHGASSTEQQLVSRLLACRHVSTLMFVSWPTLLSCCCCCAGCRLSKPSCKSSLCWRGLWTTQ